MALTVLERAALQLQLDEARVVLHRVELGQSEVSLSYNGESVAYSSANAGELRAYIRRLEYQLGLRAAPRARARGEITTDVDGGLLTASLAGILLHRSFVLGEPVDRATLEEIVDTIILPAAGHPAAPARRTHSRSEGPS